MCEEKGIGWDWITNDVCLTDQPALLWGIVVIANQKGGYVKIYSGTSASGGRLVGEFAGADEVSTPVMFYKPLNMAEGIFVEFVSHVDGVLVLYE